jgi:hypothetical protein
MSSLQLCDGDDCFNTENDRKIYNISGKTREFLRTHCQFWFNFYIKDICQDCIDCANADYEGFFVIDDNGSLRIGDEYIAHPSLLD